MKVATALVIVPLLAVGDLAGQSFQRVINPFPVSVAGVAFETPFLGGFNKPNPQIIDFNADGSADIFLSDEDGRLQHFLNDGTPSNPDFSLQTKYFEDIIVGRWFQWWDYDHDTDLDLICQTNGTSTVSLYQRAGDQLTLITTQLETDSGLVINGGLVVVPTLADLNSDGWADLFVGDMSGTVTFYRNLGIMDNQPLFHFVTDNWQDISIVWIPGKTTLHGTNALEFFDIDSDGDLDLFWGDFYQPGLFYLENIGSPTIPVIRDSMMVTSYPPGNPVETAGFNIPRLTDLDNDGDGDLMVGVQSGAYGVDQTENFWYYENVGMPQDPVFQLQTQNFLLTLDVGSRSIPALVDIDNDNDLDLFIGTESNPQNPQWNGDIFYFVNTGTPAAPSFSLTDSSLLGNTIGSYLAPAFADLDGDGDNDAYVGEWFGRIYHFENIGTPEEPLFTPRGQFAGIDLAGKATPAFSDIDDDGDLDLFVGDKFGRIHYWQNTGTPLQYDFVKISGDFLNGSIDSDIAPAIYDLDGDSDMDFILGTWYESLYFAWNNNGAWEIVPADSVPYSGLNIAPALGDLNNDGTPELLLGSRTGGLQFFVPGSALSTGGPGVIPIDFELNQNYPNPFNHSTVINYVLESPASVSLIVYDLSGDEISRLVNGYHTAGRFGATWNAAGLSSGTYLYRLVVGGRSRVRRSTLLK